MQRIAPPPLRNSPTSTTTTSKPHSSSCARTRSGQAGITIGAAEDDRVGAEVSPSSSVSTSGSGTRSSSAAAEASSYAAGQTIARVSSRGQKPMSMWYIPGCVIRTPADAHPEVGGEVLERELLGARAVADDQLAAPGERVTGLEVGTDAVAADRARGEAVLGEPRVGGRGLHPALRVAHVREHHPARRAVGALERQAEVHRVDHVGRVGQLRQHLDGAAGGLDRGDEGEPLLRGRAPGRAGRRGA